MYVSKYTYILHPWQTDLINDGKDHDGAHLGSDRLGHPGKCLKQGRYRAVPACMCGHAKGPHECPGNVDISS